MMNATKLFPGIGWVRADKVSNEKLLTELNELRKENEKLKALTPLSSLIPTEELAPLEDELEIYGTRTFIDFAGLSGEARVVEEDWEAKSTWQSIFSVVSPLLVSSPDDVSVNQRLTFQIHKNDDYNTYKISDYSLETLKIQFQALGLINVSGSGLWQLTQEGKNLMVRLRAVKRRPTPID